MTAAGQFRPYVHVVAGGSILSDFAVVPCGRHCPHTLSQEQFADGGHQDFPIDFGKAQMPPLRKQRQCVAVVALEEGLVDLQHL